MTESERRRRIVVGVDHSAGAVSALNWAAEEAAWRRADLVVVHAYGVPGEPVPALHGSAVSGYELEEDAKRLLDCIVGPAVGAAGLAPGRVETIAVHGLPTAVLREAAIGADLLVVGTRGRGGFAGLLLGSVSRSCVLHAPCPVCVVPPGRDG